MIKPETKIMVGQVTAGLFLILASLALVLEIITPNYVKPEPTNIMNFVLLAVFVLLYSVYYFTLVKKLYRAHFVVWLIFVITCIVSLSPIAVIPLLLLSQSVWGMFRLKSKE